MEVVMAILETPMRAYWIYSASDCRLFAFYDGTTSFSRVPPAVLEELAAAKRAGEFRVEIRRTDATPICVEGKCIGARLKPRLVVVKGKYGVYVVRGRRVPLAVPEEDVRLLLAVV